MLEPRMLQQHRRLAIDNMGPRDSRRRKHSSNVATSRTRGEVQAVSNPRATTTFPLYAMSGRFKYDFASWSTHLLPWLHQWLGVSAILDRSSTKRRECEWLKQKILAGKQRCPFRSCPEYLNPSVAAEIRENYYQRDTKAQKYECKQCGLPKRELTRIGCS